jgi:tetratricopeptide (TPR) repeat protein
MIRVRLSCVLILGAISLGETQQSPQLLLWQQALEHSLQTYNYQPLLDEFQKQKTDVQDTLCVKTAEFAAHISENSMRREDVFYTQKLVLFLDLCRNTSSPNEKIEVFCRTFPSESGLLTALREAGDICFYIRRDFQQAQELYQRVLNASANSPEGIWAQRGLVMTALEKRDFSLADTCLETLLNRYSLHPQVETAVRIVADRYFYASKPETAGRLYEWLIQRPASQESIWALRGLAMVNLRLADYPAADAAIEQLTREYSDHPQYDLALREAADEYFYWGHNPLQAQSLYQLVLESRPEGSQAIWAQQGLILTAIELGDLSRARAELQVLLAKYEEHQQIATAVRIAADRFFYFGNAPELACSLYERILQNWPASPEAMAARRGLAMGKVRLGDFVLGNESAEKLLSDFGGEAGIEEKTAEVLEEYCQLGRTNEVISLTGKILQQNPSRSMQLIAYAGLARVCVQIGQEEKAADVLQILQTAFAKEERLGPSLFGIGEEYYLRGGKLCSEGNVQKGREDLNQAIRIWEMVPRYSAGSVSAAHALYYTAAARQQLGQYEQALKDYQQLLLQWPAYEKAWFAQFQAARCSEELYQEKRLSKEAVQAAYQKVLEKYPFGPAARLAAERLSKF